MLCEPRSGFQPYTAQEFGTGGLAAPGTLHAQEAERAFSARDRRVVVEHRPGLAPAFGASRAEHLDALHPLAEIGLEESARMRREPAHQILQRAGLEAPVD